MTTKAITLTPATELAAMQPTMQQVVALFVDAQDVKQSSKALYKRTVELFLGWLNGKGYEIGSIDRRHILEYKEELLADGKSSLTVGSYITAVRRFFEWTEAQKLYPNVARGIRNPKRKQVFKKQPLRPEQATELLAYERTSQSVRDYALVNLLLRTGLRTIEASRANVGDVTVKGGQRVLMVQGKGRDEKDNFVVLTPKTWEPIKEYLASRPDAKDNEPLFESTSNHHGKDGSRLSTRTISGIAKDGLKAIGLDDRRVYSAHSLRHTTATNILRAGGSLEQVQLTLRHSNPATTQIYTNTLNEERRLAASGESLLDMMY